VVGVVPAVTISGISSSQSGVICDSNGGSSFPVTVDATGVGSGSGVNSTTPMTVSWSYTLNGGSTVFSLGTSTVNTTSGQSSYQIPGSILASTNPSGTTYYLISATVTGVNAAGAPVSATSAPFTITINPNAAISAQPSPASSTVCSGNTTSLSIGVSGIGPVLQWQELSSDSGAAWVNLPGQSSTSLTVPALAPAVGLNSSDDPNFEMGIANVTQLQGTGIYFWDGTTPAAYGSHSVGTSGGQIILATPSTAVPLDPTGYYLVLADVYSDTVGRTASLGVSCFDAGGNAIAPQGGADGVYFRPIPTASSVTVGSGSATWQVIGGILKGTGALTDLSGTTGTFRTGTASVQVVASLEEGAISGTAHLDNVRIIPLNSNEASLLLSGSWSNAMTLAAYAQARMGPASDGNTTRSFQYRVAIDNSSDGCGGLALYSQTATVTSEPLPNIISYPAHTQTCANTPVTLAVGVQGGGSPSFQWMQSPNGVSGWLPMDGQNSKTLTLAGTNNGSTTLTTYYMLEVITSCGTIQTPAIEVDVLPGISITSQITGVPSAVASGTALNLAVGAIGVTSSNWQQSINGGLWTALVSPNILSLSTTPTASGTTLTNYEYKVQLLSSNCGTVTSGVQSVNVYPPLIGTVVTSDGSTNYCAGNSATLTVDLSSGYLPQAQWQANSGSGWTNVGSTGPLSYSPTAPAVSGSTPVTVQYRALLTDAMQQTAMIGPISVTWNPSLAITTQPASTSIATGAGANLNIVVNGVGLTYQWNISSDRGNSWNVVSGATNASFATGALTAPTGTSTTTFLYRCIVSGPGCSGVVSSTATVTVYPVPAGTVTASNGTSYCSGSLASLATTISSGSNLTYQWQVYSSGLWTPVTGATAMSYYPVGTASGSTSTTSEFCVVATDPVGQFVMSNPVYITWNPAPAITAQPASASLPTGSSTTLGITATGQNLTYQWQLSVDGGTTWNAIPNATGVSLVTGPLNAKTPSLSVTAFLYRVLVQTPGCTTVYSSVAQISVYPVPIAAAALNGTSPACSGSSIPLQANETSGSGLTVQWQVLQSGIWVNIPGATSVSYSPTASVVGMNPVTNQYRPFMTDAVGQTAPGGAITVSWVAQVTFTAQPIGTTVCAGGNTTLSTAYQGPVGVTVSGFWESSPDSANWSQVLGTGSTSTILNITGITASSYYRYHITTGVCSDVYSGVVQVVVVPIPSINQEPQDQTICAGQSAIFSVATNMSAANGSYQWYVSTNSPSGPWSVIVGATQATLTLANMTNSSTTNLLQWYRAQVIPNVCGQAMFSTSATLTIQPNVTIVNQPQNIQACLNTPATLSVVTVGQTASYSWQQQTSSGWVDMGLTGPSVSVPTNVLGTFTIRGVVNAVCGTSYTNTVTLTVAGATQITKQPQGLTACQGSSASLSVGATGAALTYAWVASTDQVTWTPTGGNTATITVIAAQTMSYRVTVLGGGGCADQVVSAVATVKVLDIPQQVPLSTPTYARTGSPAYISVAEDGPSYDSVTWTFQGQTYQGNSVVLQMPGQAGTYPLLVSANANGCQSVTNWNLAVEDQGNGDVCQLGVIDARDFGRFMAAFGTKAGDAKFDEALDLNGDGVIDEKDLLLFWNEFGAAVQTGSTSSSVKAAA
jgi:hypothetical protein